MSKEAKVPDDPREQFERLKPRLGGLAEPVRFSDKQIAILNAAADQIIPPGGGFPAPSSVGVVEFMGRYITPSGQEPQYFPFAAEDAFKAAVDKLGDEFLSANPAEQVEILKRTEQESPAFFEQLRNLVYYGYYSRPQVIQAINQNLEAARDYRGPPQPYGYLHAVEKWDESTFPRGRGKYIRTADVKPVIEKGKEV